VLSYAGRFEAVKFEQNSAEFFLRTVGDKDVLVIEIVIPKSSQ